MLLVGFDTQPDLAAGGEQQHFRPPMGRVGEHVGALRNAAGTGVLAPVEGRHCLARENEACGTIDEVHHDPPGFDDFVRVRRAQQHHAGHGAE